MMSNISDGTCYELLKKHRRREKFLEINAEDGSQRPAVNGRKCIQSWNLTKLHRPTQPALCNALSTGNGYRHYKGRNGTFCITAVPRTGTAGISALVVSRTSHLTDLGWTPA